MLNDNQKKKRRDNIICQAMAQAKEEFFFPLIGHMPKIGEYTDGQGNYEDTITIEETASNHVHIYSVFSAPDNLKAPSGEDLRVTFRETAETINKMSPVLGYKGYQRSEQDVGIAIVRREYQGEWFLPTIQMVAQQALPQMIEESLGPVFADAMQLGLDKNKLDVALEWLQQEGYQSGEPNVCWSATETSRNSDFKFAFDAGYTDNGLHFIEVAHTTRNLCCVRPYRVARLTSVYLPAFV